MAGPTVYGDISRTGAAYVVVEALAHAEPIIVLGKLGLSKPMPKNKSATISFRRPVPFAVSTTPIVEGVTPTAKSMSYDRVEATLSQYGDLVSHTDKMADLSTDPDSNTALREIGMLLGEQAAETCEMLTYGVLKAGTNVYYANGSARNAVNTVITVAKQQAVTRGFQAQRARKITEVQDGTVKVGTKPVEAAFIAVAHTNVESDIRALAGFKTVAEYSNRKPICEQELGSVMDVRYIISPLFTAWADAGGAKGTMYSTSGTSADVYPVIYLAREAFGMVTLAGRDSIVPTVIAVDTPSKSDPMAQRGYASWKTWYVAMILNELWIARLEVAVTAL